MMPSLARTIALNTVLLSAAMAALYAMAQLVLAIATITFASVTGSAALAGLGPAIWGVSSSIAAITAGNLMDKYGRIPVLATGFAAGIAGAIVVAIGVSRSSGILVVAGFIILGSSFGTAFLSRVAAADMYPADRRAWAMAIVLFGAVFGALLGPLVFGPMFQGAGSNVPVAPWYAAAGFMALGLLIILGVRPDPSRIADQLMPPAGAAQAAPGAQTPAVSSLRQIIQRPGVPSAIFTAVTSLAVMFGMMSMAGLLLVNHGHGQQTAFPVLSAHFLGMFAFILVVGKLVQRIGHRRAMILGLSVLAASIVCVPLVIDTVTLIMVALFGVGLGWSIAFLGANAELSVLTEAHERGRILGFTDLASGLGAASMALFGGLVLAGIGLVGLAVGGALLALLPVYLVARRPSRDQA